jgi:hypothetical protein
LIARLLADPLDSLAMSDIVQRRLQDANGQCKKYFRRRNYGNASPKQIGAVIGTNVPLNCGTFPTKFILA